MGVKDRTAEDTMICSKSALIIPWANVEIEIETRSGLRSFIRAKNRILKGGRDVVRDLLGNVGYPPKVIGLGSSDVEVADGDESLLSEFYSREIDRRIVTASKIRYQTFVDYDEANGTGSNWIREVGLFAGGSELLTGGRGSVATSATGVLFARALVSPIEKDDTKRFTISWEVPISAV
jgi:hypothetical protein